MQRRLCLTIAAALLPLSIGTAAIAQEYPTRPITLVAPFSAGGALDLIARAMAEKLGTQFGQSVVVDNKAGAAGMIGTAHVARSAPDGYSLVLGATTTHGINPVLYKKMQYDVLKDFEPVSLIATIPHMIVVHPDLPVSNMQELIKLGRTKPLNFGSAGTGSPHHLAGELLKSQFNLKAEHIPYKGSAPAMLAVMSGELQFMSVEVTAAMPHIKAGKLKPIAVASAQRVPGLDLPTFAEQGVPNFEVTAWYAIFAPKNTPRPVVDKLSRALARAVSEEDVKARFAGLGATPVGSTPAQLDKWVRDELARWSQAVKVSGTPLVE
ncbi:tripartite tricarboxylate transporter substrate binding protein [Ramlibacter sp. AW1]|uniref:Tripartite tricarboxylate transporter substrate binding protein n=1 Tax=Ramlibacter aurantiacus TaxID=2801330 RepID=A0A936ZSH3_9BURK|nr:tripartite tricarboxylate transporter substrate binding protein [Ramlibacter aurantiacus]MBL0422643.1 tripartite tricarboxylate transporter substrate binding protein [Ramlibacter aurantiacus]